MHAFVAPLPPLRRCAPRTRASTRRRPRVCAQVSSSAPNTQRVLASLDAVSYDVGGVNVVDDISLDLREGEIVCILGPSGSGKSTVLRILAGLTRPSSGEVLYHGKPFVGTNPGAAIVFQTFALYPWLTVLENVELGCTNSDGSSEKRSRALKAIDIIGLDGYENAYPRELSGGMRQRVGFARALAVEPEFLCMDEPFSALDVLTAENLRSELLRLWQAGDVPTTSVLIVTHGIEEAVSLADRIVILGRDPGHIRTILPVRMAHPRNRKSTHFQELADLVYTLLSDTDYSMSEDDLATLTLERHNIDSQVANVPAVVGATANFPPPLLRVPLDTMSMSEPLRTVAQDLIINEDENGAPGTQDPEMRYPQLPGVRIGSVGGLLSFLADEPADLYLLGQRLQLDVDDLYPIIDAASILDLIELDDGDVRMNEKGRLFFDASIDDRKGIVKEAVLSSPGSLLIRQIHRLLCQVGASQRLPQELIFDTILLKHFSPQESKRQLEIAIEWGRFAELFGYESLTGTLFLDTGESGEL